MPDKYRHMLVVSVGSACAVLLHLYLGWEWAILAGAGVGGFVERRSWWYGGLALTVTWGALVAWNLVVAGGPTIRMADAMGALIGGVPGWIFFIMTLAAGFGLGAVGGLVGYEVRRVIREFSLMASRRAR